MYIFPGIGLAASVAGVTRITDEMLYRAAVTCSECMNEEERRQGRVFPSIRRIREVSRAVAVEIIHVAMEHNMAPKINRHAIEEGLSHLVNRKMYYPRYVPLVNKH
jgi:malate dehydrogenase (oxaloacetate-decarboxylating)(NADP+)